MERVQRTTQQNRALHKYFALLATELNAAGLDMKATLKPSIEIPWTPENVKEHLWKPFQNFQLNRESTTDLSVREVDDVYNTLNRHLGEKLHIHVPFPSAESDMF
jgi:hypothetical protein